MRPHYYSAYVHVAATLDKKFVVLTRCPNEPITAIGEDTGQSASTVPEVTTKGQYTIY